MCGRYLITTAPEAMRALFRYREFPNFPARYNVAPTQPVPIVRLSEGARQFALAFFAGRHGVLPLLCAPAPELNACKSVRVPAGNRAREVGFSIGARHWLGRPAHRARKLVRRPR